MFPCAHGPTAFSFSTTIDSSLFLFSFSSFLAFRPLGISPVDLPSGYSFTCNIFVRSTSASARHSL